jgi:hypothetical protein
MISLLGLRPNLIWMEVALWKKWYLRNQAKTQLYSELIRITIFSRKKKHLVSIQSEDYHLEDNPLHNQGKHIKDPVIPEWLIWMKSHSSTKLPLKWWTEVNMELGLQTMNHIKSSFQEELTTVKVLELLKVWREDKIYRLIVMKMKKAMKTIEASQGLSRGRRKRKQ